MTRMNKKAFKDGVRETILRLQIAKVWKEGKDPKEGKYHPANLHSATALCICCFIDAMGKYSNVSG